MHDKLGELHDKLMVNKVNSDICSQIIVKLY